MGSDELQAFIDGPKRLEGSLAWNQGDRALELACSVEQDGITVEGMQFRGKTPYAAKDRGVMFQLQYLAPDIGRMVPLTRVDWRSGRPHVNKLGPLHLRHKIVGENQIHRFEDNIDLGLQEMLAGNLPVADDMVPVPRSFEELLVFLRENLRIMNVDRIMSPPWQEQGSLLSR